MIYRPPERERRARGRMSPSREVALVVVGIALVTALLFPVAFPNVPLPGTRLPTVEALAPPTPVSMPRPYGEGLASGTPPAPGFPPPGGTPAFGPASATPPGGELLAPPTPAGADLLLPTTAPVDRFPAGLPTARPRPTRETPPTPIAYPGLPSATPAGQGSATPSATAAASGSPTGSPTAGTATVTGTPATGTPTPTATASAYP